MQEIAKQYLPQIVYEKTPEDKWIEINGLNPGAVDRIFGANLVGLKLPEHKDSFYSLSNKLYQISRGNPLHLRYTLKQMKNQLGVKDKFPEGNNHPGPEVNLAWFRKQ